MKTEFNDANMLILKKYFSFIQSENAPFISKKCKSKEKAITNYFQKKKNMRQL